MKVIQSARKLYEQQVGANNMLQITVDEMFKKEKKDNWHYESRIKSVDSFALKIESGRFDPVRLEDFFACRIVVNSSKAIEEAMKLIKSHFEIVRKRPPDPLITHKSPDLFAFDDLRLYVKLKENKILPPRIQDNIIFEIQVKTFLQHAWQIATHDLIYKANNISWSKQRIAFQIKAMLEHAELSIEAADDLANLPNLSKSDEKILYQKDVMKTISGLWEKEDLPNDLTTFTRNLAKLLTELNISTQELKTLIEKETNLGKGTKTRNLSPYAIVIQTLIYTKSTKLKRFLCRHNQRRTFKIYLPPEIEITDFFHSILEENIIRT